jgi:pimeloyl-[acyl-carrier protein] methyl ester esterase
MTSLGRQNIVFMPGLDGTGLSAEPLLKLISSDTTVTVICYPTDKQLSFPDILECAAEQFPAGIMPVVIAESFSGPVAIELIASGRVQAKCLILCATFARAPRPILFRISRFFGLAKLIRPVMPQHFFRIFLGKEYMQSLIPLWERVHAGVAPHVLNHRLGLINSVDVTKWLEKLSVPCCYLQATNDRVVPSSCLIDMEKGISGLVTKKIKGPHFILQAEPQACLIAIEEFLRGKCEPTID